MKGYKVLFTPVSEMLHNLNAAKADNTYYQKVDYYLKPDLLILDELGFKRLPRYSADDFFEIISKRYEKGSLIITTNKTFEQWGDIFTDNILASAYLIVWCIILRSSRLMDQASGQKLSGKEEINSNIFCFSTMEKSPAFTLEFCLTLREQMVETSEANLAQPVKEVAADAGYSSYDNYEYLGRNNKIGYIPNQNFRKDLKGKGPYHRDHFSYDPEKDIFLCPEGKVLKLYKIRRKDCPYRKFQMKIYKAKACPHCPKRTLCTRQKYRTLSIEDRKVLLD